MSDKTPWQTCKQAGVVCAECGHDDRCLVAPKGDAYFCQREGKVHQVKNAIACTLRPQDYTKQSEPKASQRTFTSAVEALAAYGKGTLVAKWTYQDADGAPSADKWAMIGGGR